MESADPSPDTSPSAGAGGVQIWRLTVPLRVSAVLLALTIFLLAVGTEIGVVHDTSSSGLTSHVLVGAVGLAALIGLWRVFLRPRIVLDAKSVTVVNPVRTVRIPLTQIGGTVTAGYGGVTIIFFDNGQMRRLTAWAVQKSNIAQWLNKTVRADRVAQQIQNAVNDSGRERPNPEPIPKTPLS